MVYVRWPLGPLALIIRISGIVYESEIVKREKVFCLNARSKSEELLFRECAAISLEKHLGRFSYRTRKASELKSV